MQVNSDFKELLSLFNEENVRYLVIGAYAVILYCEPRFTKDLHLWIAPDLENARHVWRALKRFGALLACVSEADFTRQDMVYQMGILPNRIDI